LALRIKLSIMIDKDSNLRTAAVLAVLLQFIGRWGNHCSLSCSLFRALLPLVFCSWLRGIQEFTHAIRICTFLRLEFPILASAADMEKSELKSWQIPENIQQGKIFL
jgi:hypothetical protein